MLRRVSENQREARLWFYGVLAATFLGAVVIAIAAEHVDLRLLGVAAGVVLLLVAILEGAIALGTKQASSALFAESQDELFRAVGGLKHFIASAAEIDILAGTGRAFTNESENLKALDGACDRGAKARILVMHDRGAGVSAETFSRRARSVATPDEEMPLEINKSLTRIAEFCGDQRTTKIVRLYSGSRTMSLYRFDDHFLITLNTGGRGSSSPAFYLRQSMGRQSFCRNIIRGFEEIWDSTASEHLTHDQLLHLRSSAPTTPVPLRHEQGGATRRGGHAS